MWIYDLPYIEGKTLLNSRLLANETLSDGQRRPESLGSGHGNWSWAMARR